MKTLILASGLAAVMFAAAAQAPPDMSTVTIPRGPQTIELPAKYNRFHAGEFERVVGVYDLSNGKTMALTMRGLRKYVRIEGAPRTEVIAVGDYDYVALDKKYRVVLQEPQFDEVRGYVLIATPAGQDALSAIEPLGGRTVAGR